MTPKNRFEWEENVPCNFCGSQESRIYLFVSKDEKTFYGHDFNLVECLNCGLVRADPRPTFESWLPRYMKISSSMKKITERKLKREQVAQIHRSRVERLLKLRKDAKTLFDIGTGGGTVLTEAQKLGLKVAGNDINGYAVKRLKDLGIEAFNLPTNRLNQVIERERRFDFIVMFDYIEHTYTPFDDLKWARHHITNYGLLSLSTMWLGSPAHEKAGAYWRLLGMGHFYYFTSEVLIKIIEAAHFEVIRVLKGEALIKVIAKPISY